MRLCMRMPQQRPLRDPDAAPAAPIAWGGYGLLGLLCVLLHVQLGGNTVRWERALCDWEGALQYHLDRSRPLRYYGDTRDPGDSGV